MGLLIDGQWQSQDIRRSNAAGEFVRNDATFRDWIGRQFPIESKRYHLFVNEGCPWAYRTILYRSIKNLEDIVSISYTEPAMGKQGWSFGETPDDLLNCSHIHEIYQLADTTFSGRATVPILWDKHRATIVNNESADIIRMFNKVFDDFEGVDAGDYCPTEKINEIEGLNQLIYDDINNGVYRCGFAQSQSAYDDAFDRLFSRLDLLDDSLRSQRFLLGDHITEPDWRLFATLVRFDLAYHGQFKCNRNLLTDYEFLWPYVRDLYQQQKVAVTVNEHAIRGIYYGSRAPGILPRGPKVDFGAPHDRGKISRSD